MIVENKQVQVFEAKDFALLIRKHSSDAIVDTKNVGGLEKTVSIADINVEDFMKDIDYLPPNTMIRVGDLPEEVQTFSVWFQKAESRGWLDYVIKVS